MKYPDVFQLYTTIDTGILIPKDGYGVILISDRGINGLESLSNLNIGNYVKYLYLPKQIMVYNKRFSINRSQFSDSIMSNQLAVIQSPKALTKSFLLDLTPYISFLFNRFNYLKYVNESIKFINNTIDSIKKELKPGVINKWIILYILDDRYLQDSLRLVDRELYGYTFIKNIQLNNKSTNALDTNIDSIFLCHCSSMMNNSKVIKMYDKNALVDYSRVRNLLMKVKPNILSSDNTDTTDNNVTNKESNTTNNLTDNSSDNINKKLVDVDTTNTSNDIEDNTNSTATIEKIDNIEEPDKDKEDVDIYKDKSVNGLFKEATKESKQYSLNGDITNIPNKFTDVIISKIDEDQFKDDRKIPIYDNEDKDIATKIINQDNDKMFPFLNSTKQKGSNLSDINRANIKVDNESKVVKLLDELIPQLINDQSQEKWLYNNLYNRLVRDPDLLEKVLKSYEDKDIHQLLVYINNDHVPYNSKIYPKKDEVDRTVIKELDDWSESNGYIEAVGSDSVLNSNLISNLVNSNMHRVMAQKQLTWNTMPKEIEGYITKLLENNGFQLIGVDMIDKKPPITKIEPTYNSEIRIKIRNKATRSGQTLTFEVPTLLEGKYHISGGI